MFFKLSSLDDSSVCDSSTSSRLSSHDESLVMNALQSFMQNIQIPTLLQTSSHLVPI